ncbi:MAG: hypothetical protein UHM16_06675 [Acutalibacteraceae bacterium]|nr:hypothetical protein [Acutalibacteraceae bacterium]
MFNNTKGNYVIPLSKAILSNEKLSEKIKEKNPEINSLTLISDVNNSYVYSDSGNSNSYTTAFVSSENSVMFSTKSGQNKFVYSYSVLDNDKITVIQDSICSKQFVDVLEEALLFVSKYPKALTAEQLLNNFETECSTQNGAKIYEAKIDGIKYYVQVMINNGNRTIRIAVE